MPEETKSAEPPFVREPPLVRCARLVLKEGCLHIDNLTGCLVHDRKVERACRAQGRPNIYEMAEDEETPANELPLLIRRKRGGPKINPVLLDATTASMIVQVWDHINEENRARFQSMVDRFGCVRWINKLWKLVR